VRDVLDVRDVVDAYARLLDRRVPAGVYNVARGIGVAVREILSMLLSLSPIEPTVQVDRALWRPASAAVGSADRLRRATGWTARIPLEETLRAVLDHWRARVSASP
jgi:GDP-4-dehydro-6-deoxy-D-mannose reductase